ncbi:membrane protein [Ktedonobacter sp. SOSP1-85]|nr:membrane protein [Ktedonobacter sp. SOSP1-85]
MLRRSIMRPGRAHAEPMTWQRRLWLVFRAIMIVVFGIVLALLPRISFFLFLAAFATLGIIDGIAALAIGFSKRRQNPRWWLIALSGVAGLVIAGLIIFAPGLTKITLIYAFAIWAIIVGVTQMLAFFRTRSLRTDWLSLLPAVFSLIIGGYLLLKSSPNVVTDVRFIGLYAIVYGILTFFQALQPARTRVAMPQEAPPRHGYD